MLFKSISGEYIKNNYLKVLCRYLGKVEEHTFVYKNGDLESHGWICGLRFLCESFFNNKY